MVGFSSQKISKKQSVGEKLRALREANFYTTKRLAKKLLIHEKYVKAIEESRFDALPDAMSTKNFIKSYAKFFKKDTAPFLNQYLVETRQCLVSTKRPQKNPQKTFRFWGTTNLTRNILICLFVLAFVSYLGFEIKKIITPPEITLSAPQDELVVRKPIIRVVGKTEKEARLKINGEIVTPHSDGSFNEEVDLQRGLNLIKISASKKYSKEKVIYRKIIFEEAVVLRN
ncbi:MAG: helix-turn-helix domain-containing protein [Patescibacteria group bacterium]|nr:helix-turn-helix domain-containing protein [Patescibacteria group bacterium]